jgi:hypothetical protein
VAHAEVPARVDVVPQAAAVHSTVCLRLAHLSERSERSALTAGCWQWEAAVGARPQRIPADGWGKGHVGTAAAQPQRRALINEGLDGVRVAFAGSPYALSVGMRREL